ncbi:MAG: DNA-3-methyladenine glycosylase 2 family protein, partial [Hyphomicrobiaceae bacterium]
FLGVTSTGIYCRPSCPARTPRPANCRFFRSGAAAVAAGFRACRRCRPDLLPLVGAGDGRSDLAGRALRLIADGTVDEVGVGGLARELAMSERHVNRILMAEVGVGASELAKARRAQGARALIEDTTLSMADVAFAAGFGSIRQFNEIVITEFGQSPSTLRRDAGKRPRSSFERAEGRAASLRVRLRARGTFASAPLLVHIADRAVPGLETVESSTITRLVGGALCSIELTSDGAVVRVTIDDLESLGRVLGAVKRWLDLDADSDRIDDTLSSIPQLAALVGATPGIRVPGTVDPAELVVRAVLGQQISTAAARRLTSRMVAQFGSGDRAMRSFPSPARLASLAPEDLVLLGLTRSKAATVIGVGQALVDGLDISHTADRAVARAALLSIPGVGPWTADYVAMRALRNPDVFPMTDLVLRREVDARGIDANFPQAAPWRSYAAAHFWYKAAVEKGHQ